LVDKLQPRTDPDKKAQNSVMNGVAAATELGTHNMNETQRKNPRFTKKP
jgi:hypothetical protein